MHSTANPDKAATLAHYREQAGLAVGLPHTPGPWVWDGTALRPADPQPDAQHVHTILESQGGGGFLCSDWRATMRELDADYRLIAAAPLLLEALESCADRLEMKGTLTDNRFAVAKARAAIAAATGAAA